MSSNATENVQTKTGSLGGDLEEEHWQMDGRDAGQKWGPWVAEGGLWVIQMHTAHADMLEYRDRWAQMLKRYSIMNNNDPTRSVSVLTTEEGEGFSPLC